MDLKVSVITPCLNSEKTIKNTIESVLGQTYQNIEYIIVDGKSSDKTLNIISEYKEPFAGRLRCISEKDKGIYDAVNKGIVSATGEVIGIINSDDWYEPDAVERAVACFENTEAGVVYGEIWFVDGNDERRRHTWNSSFPPHPSTFIKREIYQKFGMYSLRYRIASDRELLLRLMAEGVLFAHENRMLANFRGMGISRIMRLECAEESREINLKYLGKCPENILNRDDIEESYNRAKMLALSYKTPMKIRNVLAKRCNLSEGVIIFGAGNCGKELEEVLRNCNIPVRCFVDNDMGKWGLEWNGIKILSPEILRHIGGYVIVTVTRFWREICEQLHGYQNAALRLDILEEIRQSMAVSEGDIERKAR